METKVDSDVIEKLSRKMQFKNFFVVPRHNRGGGLALLWKETFAIKVLTSSDNHIDGVVDQGLMTPGISRVSMENLKLPAGNIPGIYSEI